MTDTAFNPNEHLMKTRGKDYLEVKWRLVWMLQATSSRAGYVTIELEHDRQNGYARYAAIAWDGSDETWRTIRMRDVEIQVCGRVGMGTKSETRADFADFQEKAETGALGRALAGIGFGTQFAPDVAEGTRVVDSPVEHPQPQRQPQRPAQQPMLQEVPKAAGLPDDGSPPNEQQITSLEKLCQALNRIMPAKETLTFVTASDLIRRLSKEYNEQRRGKQQGA